ncbi:MAG: hypothetical protein QM723_05280 [Myxococcaceae bacterium]
MLLGQPLGRQKKGQLSARIDQDLIDYLHRRAGKVRGALTQLLEAALRQSMVLEEALEPEIVRLQKFAADRGLDLQHSSPQVIAAAVKAALDAHGKRK